MVHSANVLTGPLPITSGISNPDTTCFLLRNNTLQPIAQALTTTTQTDNNTTTPIRPMASKSANSISEHETSSIHNDEPKPIKRKENNIHSIRDGNTTPLDLSVRRLSNEFSSRERSASLSSSVSGEIHHLNVDGKENLSINNSNSVSPEQIVCAPSLPGSPPLTPSPKRSITSPRGILTISPNSLPSSLHQSHSNSQLPPILRPLLNNDFGARLVDNALNGSLTQSILDQHRLELALTLSNNNSLLSSSPSGSSKTTPPPITNLTNKKSGIIVPSSTSISISQPQVFVKQGVSKCKECNIVFCKHENYLVHKKHYCSARNLDENSDSKTKPSPPTSPLTNNVTGNSTGPPHAYQQLICAACGIKFGSLDNLQAHQMYYCPKRIEIAPQVKFVKL